MLTGISSSFGGTPSAYGSGNEKEMKKAISLCARIEFSLTPHLGSLLKD